MCQNSIGLCKIGAKIIFELWKIGSKITFGLCKIGAKITFGLRKILQKILPCCNGLLEVLCSNGLLDRKSVV